MSVFGWHYPAGAENDPRAPWNTPDALPCRCDECDFESHDFDHGDACVQPVLNDDGEPSTCDGIMREVEPYEPDWDD